MKRTALIAPLSIAVLAFGASSAQAVIVGSPSQSNAQNAQTNQGVNQTAGGGVTVGPTVQAAGNSSNTGLSNTQAVAGGGAIIGSPAQSNSQAAATNQAVNQNAGAGVTVGPTVQAANNNATTNLGSTQLISGAGVLIGSPTQSNAQNAATNQAIGQATGPGVHIGPTLQFGGNASAIGIANLQIII